jgi:hypothetical protein
MANPQNNPANAGASPSPAHGVGPAGGDATVAAPSAPTAAGVQPHTGDPLTDANVGTPAPGAPPAAFGTNVNAMTPGTPAPRPPVDPTLLVGELERDAHGRLTQKGMQQQIARGGTVLMSTTPDPAAVAAAGPIRAAQGRLITNAAQIPSDVELAGNDPAALERAERQLADEERRLTERREQLDRQRKAAAEQQPAGQQPQARRGGGAAPR